MKDFTPQHSRAWHFLALAFGLTWLFWIPASILSQSGGTPLTRLLHYAGGVGPLAAALLLLSRTGRAERRDYWQRAIQFKRMGGGWLAVTLLAAPLLTGLAVLLDALLGGQGAQPEAAAQLATNPLAIVMLAAFLFVFGPVPEELAWRGYGLDRLQARRSALSASLILGLAWTVWHLPLFFIEGTYQNGLGIGTLPFWLFLLDKVPQTIVMTWIYNNTRRSTLAAILLHFMVNFSGELLALTARADLILIGLWYALAAAVTAVWGAETLAHRPVRLARTGRAANL